MMVEVEAVLKVDLLEQVMDLEVVERLDIEMMR